MVQPPRGLQQLVPSDQAGMATARYLSIQARHLSILPMEDRETPEVLFSGVTEYLEERGEFFGVRTVYLMRTILLI